MRCIWIALGIIPFTALPSLAEAQEVRPSHRVGAAVAFDAARGRVVLFGGMDVDANEPQSDTWEFDGERWHAAGPRMSPPARAFAAITYDAGRNRVVLFGGANDDDALGDTWEWDGTAWAERRVTGPAARMLAEMVYDPAGRRTLLVGGLNPESDVPYDDVWAWDGSAWTELDRGAEFSGMTLAERTRRRAYRAVMRSDLRNLANVQEMYFADNMTYAGSLETLADLFTPSMGVTIAIVEGSAQGWSAWATHERVPDARCAMWVGTAEPLLDGDRGAAVCEGFED